MLFIDNIPILTTVEEVINDLKIEFANSNIRIFEKVNNRNSNYTMVSCCFHENRNQPDLMISKFTTDKHEAGFFYCFGCKEKGTLPELISHLYGKKDKGEFGKSYLLNRYSNYEIENREGMMHKLSIPVKAKKEKEVETNSYITEEQLDKYRYIHPYLYKRGLTDEDIYKYDLGYDNNNIFGKCIVFPIRNEAGKCVSLGRRTIYNKHYYYPKDFSKGDYLYGYYEMRKQFPSTNEIYVCESVFNLYTLNRLGFPTVALLGTGTSKQANILKKLPYRKVVLALDSDEAGEVGCNKLRKKLCYNKIVKRLKVLDEKKDFNDLSFCKTKEELLSHCMTM